MILDSSFPSLTQGVSQQIPFGRLEGQLSEQLNMLSDRVTGVRRRPGAEYKQLINTVPSTSLSSFFIEQGDLGYHVFINNVTGGIFIYDTSFTLIHTGQSAYFIAALANDIRTVTLGGVTWILNTNIAPTLGAPDLTKQDPDKTGWVYILTGAYSKQYSVTVAVTGTFNTTYTYTTPSGSVVADVAKSVPEYIANQLALAMNADPLFTAKFVVVQEGPAIYIAKAFAAIYVNPIKVVTTAGKLYGIASGAMQVPLVTDLPANLPAAANGVVTAVGTNPRSLGYYRWDDLTSTWIESGDALSALTVVNMPRRLTITAGVAVIDTPVFEGRLAGDNENNPYSAFTLFGITGIGAYQGRLVLLAGGYCCMSASNRPLRFMRSTVTDLRDDDPIEISAGALASASFRYAVPFNKDLVLMSASHQAVVPAGQAAITPKNALVVLSGTEALAVTAEPTVMGRTLMYATAVSPQFYGAGELIPSQDSNSQYIANNLTAHIPRYVAGACRGIVSVSAAGLGCYLSTGLLNEILVNEYSWSGAERIQNAWHKWLFAVPLLSMHTAKGVLVLTYSINSKAIITTLDTRSASYQQSSEIPAFLDVRSNVTVTNNTFTVPVHLRSLLYSSAIRAAQASGTLTGEPVGIVSLNTTTWVATTVRSFANGVLTVGYNYKSSLTPTEPYVRDKEGKPILSADAHLLRYVVGVKNTGEFDVGINSIRYTPTSIEDSGILWSSVELGLGVKQAVSYGKVIVPVRAVSESTIVEFSTDNTRELNISNISYTIKGTIKRKQG
jgi:hypothetical protein